MKKMKGNRRDSLPERGDCEVADACGKGARISTAVPPEPVQLRDVERKVADKPRCLAPDKC
jgi:hypothetical protein